MEGLKEIFTNRTYPRKSFPRSPWTTTVACVTFLWLCHFTFSRFYIEPKQVSYGHKRALDDLTKVKVTVLDFNRRVIEADDGVKTSLALNHVAAGKISRNDFGTWLNEQEVISWENMLRNIADTNLNNDLASKRGVAEGAVVASPSTSDPDYFYQWTRDSAITIGTVVKTLLDDANVNITVFGSVFKYIENSRKLQRVTNPSGNFNDLSGLGEAKFMVDNTAFQGAWGRPQNDGPALRIMTISSFLKALRKHQLDVPKALEAYRSKYGENSLPVAFRNEQEIFDQVINYDVRFVMDRWSEDNFDLWEEVKGRHFFTTLCQLKALKLTLNDLTLGVFNTDDSFVNELKNRINEITHFLTSDGGFLNPNLNFVVETPSVLGGRSGLDIATVIASILTHDEIPGEDTSSVSIPFDVDSPAVLNVLYEIAKKMSTLYPINHQVPSNMGVALGRYPEDIYNGHGTSEGNPWFLATSYAAELIYKFIAHHYHQKKDIVIAVSQDKSMSAFWNSILDGLGNLRDNASEVNIPYDSPAFHQTMDTLFSYGDSFLDIERQHVTDQGEMSEQFNKYTGFSQGASNLTWSYGAFLSSVRWRKIAQEAVQKKD